MTKSYAIQILRHLEEPLLGRLEGRIVLRAKVSWMRAWGDGPVGLMKSGVRYTFSGCISTEAGMQVAKWGNSLAVRLPAAVVEALELKAGDEVEIHIADARQFAVTRKPGREALLQRLRGFRGRLPADFTFDRDEANAR